MAYNYSDLISFTLDEFRPGLTDNIFQKYPTIKMFKKNEVKVKGGVNIDEFLEVADSTANISAVVGDATFTVAETDIGSKAVYPWSTWRASARFLRDEIAKNSGTPKLFDVMAKRVKNLESSVSKDMNTWLYTASTGGLPIGLPDIMSTSSTLGGLDPASATYWKAYVDTVGAAASASNIYDVLVDLYQTTGMYNTGEIDVMFTTRDIFNIYRAAAADKVDLRLGDPAELGVNRGAVVDGIPIYWDPAVTAKTVYGLNFDTLKMNVHEDLWLDDGGDGVISSADSQVLTKNLFSMTQITTDARRSLGMAVFS